MSRSLSARAGGITMTEGSLYKNIFLFSVPLIFSQLLQVLFNMADVAVVGKFSSATALGSVGSTSTLVTLFTGFLIGLSNGVNVRVAQYLGAKQEEDTRNCVHTSLILCALSGLVIAVLCFFLAAPMLELLRTKDDLLPGAVLTVETIPAVTQCQACGRQYETVRYGRTCPHCQSPDTYLVQGSEMMIKEIEAVEADDAAT